MGQVAAALRQLDVGGPSLIEVLGTETGPSKSGEERTAAGDWGPFVGRAAEQEALLEALTRPGMLTVKGPAGIGKSRLARQVASRWASSEACPALSCTLTDVRSRDGLLFEVARALDVQLTRGDTAAQLGHALAARGTCVVVLDSFEHITQLARMVSAWSMRAPRARFMLTSRTVLGIGAERVHEVGPLRTEDASALLVTRALDRGADIAADPDLTELARRLDGLPLALELAAGRLGVLSIRDVLERFGLHLLRDGTETRHGTLRAALDWSWELLGADERAALCQLSVFSGGLTLEAAEQVLALDGSSVFDAITNLSGNSMVAGGASGRFRLLTSIQAYATEHRGSHQGALERHGRYFAELARSETSAYPVDRDRIAPDLDNLLAACERARDRGDYPSAVHTLAAVWAVLDVRGPHGNVAKLAVQLADEPGLAPRHHATAQVVAAHALSMLGRTEEALERFQDALAAYRELGDRKRQAMTLSNLGGVHRARGEMDDALTAITAALDMSREDGDRVVGAAAQGNLANALRALGRTEEATANYEAAIAAHIELGNRQAHSTMLGNLATLYRESGRVEEARDHLERALGMKRELGDQVGLALVLSNLANLHRQQGRMNDAASAYEEALTLQRSIGDRSSEGVSLGNLGLVHSNLGDTERAMACFEEARDIHREVGNRAFETLVLGNMGNLRSSRGELDAARNCYEEALVVCRVIGRRYTEAMLLANIGALLVETGHLDEAHPRYTAALAIAREINAKAAEGFVLASLGDLHHGQGRDTEAQACFAQALELHRGMGSRRSECQVLSQLAIVDLDQGRSEAARAGFEAALVLALEVSDKRLEGYILGYLARLVDPGSALALLDRGEALLRASSERPMLAILLASRARVCWKAGDEAGCRAALADAAAAAPSGHTCNSDVASARAATIGPAPT
jgi:tetratricopeptide (TPR) repeat protein